MSAKEQRYVPAAGRAVFTPLFDPLAALTMRERRWRPDLVRVAGAALPQGGTVVDVGADTGTVTVALAVSRLDATVIAADGDPAALDVARGKEGAELVDWREGTVDRLPVPGSQANTVVMSMLLHHLATPSKRAALEEAHRARRPDGQLLIADFGRPRGVVPRAGFAAVRVIDGRDGTADHAAGLLAQRIEEAGFSPACVWKRLPIVWGTVELLATRPAAS